LPWSAALKRCVCSALPGSDEESHKGCEPGELKLRGDVCKWHQLPIVPASSSTANTFFGGLKAESCEHNILRGEQVSGAAVPSIPTSKHSTYVMGVSSLNCCCMHPGVCAPGHGGYNCKVCKPGFYSPGGSLEHPRPDCKECGPHFTSPPGAVSAKQCSCKAGYGAQLLPLVSVLGSKGVGAWG